MRVVVQVPDLDVALLDVGDPATVVIDALKGRSFTGAVSRLARAENPTHPHDASRDRPGKPLAACSARGCTAARRSSSGPLRRACRSPRAACSDTRRTGQAKVYVVSGDHLKSTNVEIGADDGTASEILSGLGPDDSVVLLPRNVVDEKAAHRAQPDRQH